MSRWIQLAVQRGDSMLKERTGSSGVLKALLLERNGQLSCNPKKKKNSRRSNPGSFLQTELPTMTPWMCWGTLATPLS